jgi:hypothetical protein
VGQHFEGEEREAQVDQIPELRLLEIADSCRADLPPQLVPAAADAPVRLVEPQLAISYIRLQIPALPLLALAAASPARLRLFSPELLQQSAGGEVLLEEGLQNWVCLAERELLYDEIERPVLLLVQAGQVLARKKAVFPQEVPEEDVFVDPERAIVRIDH